MTNQEIIEEDLLTLLDNFFDDVKHDTRYGIWVTDANDRNTDVRVYTLTDFRNWLKVRSTNE